MQRRQGVVKETAAAAEEAPHRWGDDDRDVIAGNNLQPRPRTARAGDEGCAGDVPGPDGNFHG